MKICFTDSKETERSDYLFCQLEFKRQCQKRLKQSRNSAFSLVLSCEYFRKNKAGWREQSAHKLWRKEVYCKIKDFIDVLPAIKFCDVLFFNRIQTRQIRVLTSWCFYSSHLSLSPLTCRCSWKLYYEYPLPPPLIFFDNILHIRKLLGSKKEKRPQTNNTTLFNSSHWASF